MCIGKFIFNNDLIGCICIRVEIYKLNDNVKSYIILFLVDYEIFKGKFFFRVINFFLIVKIGIVVVYMLRCEIIFKLMYCFLDGGDRKCRFFGV